METFFIENWEAILVAVVAGVALKFIFKAKSSNSSKQTKNVVGGDMAGRDINKK